MREIAPRGRSRRSTPVPLWNCGSNALCTTARASAEYSFSTIPESVGPGLIAFTRTPCSASSDAAVRAKDRRAAFDAAYALVLAFKVRVDRGVEDNGPSARAGEWRP